jgi:hypothetical protein
LRKKGKNRSTNCIFFFQDLDQASVANSSAKLASTIPLSGLKRNKKEVIEPNPKRPSTRKEKFKNLFLRLITHQWG